MTSHPAFMTGSRPESNIPDRPEPKFPRDWKDPPMSHGPTLASLIIAFLQAAGTTSGQEASPRLAAPKNGSSPTPRELPARILTARKTAGLRKRLRDWYEVELEATDKLNESRRLGHDTRRARILRKQARRLRSKARKEKEQFQKEFQDQCRRSGDLLKSVADMRAILAGCFPHRDQHNGGVVKTEVVDRDSEIEYALRFPPGYDTDRDWPVVVLLAPHRSQVDPDGAEEYLEATWPKSATAGLDRLIVVSPRVPDDLAGEDSAESPNQRNERRRLWLLRVLADVFLKFRVDTDRVYLDVAGDAIPFALRIATLFPDRFAGLVLRNPEIVGELDDAIVLENLNQAGALIVTDVEHEPASRELAQAFEREKQASVTIHKEEDGATSVERAAVAMRWLQRTRRDLFKTSLTLMPAHDRLRKCYWLAITKAAYLAEVPEEERPRVQVAADRKHNRIEVTGRNVDEIRLLLNDLLVDLDKPITLVANGRIKEVQIRRSLPMLADARRGLVVLRNDPRFVFVAQCTVPIPEGE